MVDESAALARNQEMNRPRNTSNMTPLDQQSRMASVNTGTPVRNVTYGVNYLLPSVHQFVATTTTCGTPSASFSRPPSPDENSKRLVNREQQDQTPQQTNSSRAAEQEGEGAVVEGSSRKQPRSSRRDRTPREKPKTKSRVRYDMNAVPVVRRNSDFLELIRKKKQEARLPPQRRSLPPRRCARREVAAAAAAAVVQEEPKLQQCQLCEVSEVPGPFLEESSVVWIPQKRAEWEDCLSEMAAVCTSAAYRRHVSSPESASKPFHAPLSQAYIRDRVDIDDPLNGYQIRHKEGGWLQGFVMWTNFTTWTHYFKWDSLHEESGVDAERASARPVDEDGSLSAELESQPRSGDPLASGVVFPTIAEISLLGGLGCGEYLLRMALDDIAQKDYRYVVLQATDGSKSFYERFGFVKVGAVTRYGFMDASKPRMAQTTPIAHSDIVGYRHWTYANETKRNLDKHGGPSYMMALRLPPNLESADKPLCSKCSKTLDVSALAQMTTVAVEEKPAISTLGITSTPASIKRNWSSLSKPIPKEASTKVRKVGRPKGSYGIKRRNSSVEDVVSTAVAEKTDSAMHRAKRRRTSATPPLLHKEYLMTPPPPGQTLSYAQKQYQSVWLAVPPTANESKGRRPPKNRTRAPLD